MLKKASDEKAKSAVIFFADMIGGSRLSEVLSPSEYIETLKEFQDCAKINADYVEKKMGRLFGQGVIIQGQCVGDELAQFYIIENPNALFEALRLSIELAIRLKLGWFLSEANSERINNQSALHNIATGLHYGTVIYDNKKKLLGGSSLNFGKRVETASREGSSTQIAISQSFLSQCRKYGLPIEIGSPLSFPAKGFEGAEPIYELSGQDVINDWPLSNNTRSNRKFKDVPSKEIREKIQSAFNRDPEKTIWIIELAIETLFSKGGDAYSDAIELGEKARTVTRLPSRVVFRTARSLHRRAYSKYRQEQDAETSIRYYLEASKDKDLVWAHNDLAAAYWKRAVNTKANENDESNSAIFSDLKSGLKECDKLIEQQPNHFYAYNLWGLIFSEKVYIDFLFGEKKTSKHSKELAKAERYLSIARHIRCNEKTLDENCGLRFLFDATEANIKRAAYIIGGNKKDKEASLKLIKRARKGLQKYVKAKRIPPEIYYLPGYAVPGLQPPRPHQLIKQLEHIEISFEDIKLNPRNEGGEE